MSSCSTSFHPPSLHNNNDSLKIGVGEEKQQVILKIEAPGCAPPTVCTTKSERTRLGVMGVPHFVETADSVGPDNRMFHSWWYCI